MPAYTLDSGCIITFEAIDPDSGAVVSGVTISNAAVYGVNDDQTVPSLTPPPPPLFVPLALSEQP
jgi:hypothetical protein